MSLENQEKNIGFVYFMTERDLFGYPCGPYVKIGLVKGNDDGRSSRKYSESSNFSFCLRFFSIFSSIFPSIFCLKIHLKSTQF